MSTAQIILIVVFGISVCHGVQVRIVQDEAVVSELGTIHVVYTVIQSVDITHSIDLQVKVGATILDVMKMAQKINPQYFKFAKADTVWGWYITTIGGTDAKPSQRTYWEFLIGNKPITVGVAVYHVKSGDHIIAKFAKY